MKRIIKLTERDLTRLVKRVINETIVIGCTTTDFQNYATNPIINTTVNGQSVQFTFKDNNQCSTNVAKDLNVEP